MTTNFHTPISTGAAANAATINAPLSELDAAIGAVDGGPGVSDNQLKAWTEGEAYEMTSITRNAEGVITSATVKWPDTSGGTFTTDTINGTWSAIDAYHITHTDSSKTVTQSLITRNGDGDVTTKPPLTVA